MKRTHDAEFFGWKCPYTGKPCYEWECDTCEVEAQEKKDAEELDREESEVQNADKKHKVEGITRGNCKICGKELTDGSSICNECVDKLNTRIALSLRK